MAFWFTGRVHLGAKPRNSLGLTHKENHWAMWQRQAPMAASRLHRMEPEPQSCAWISKAAAISGSSTCYEQSLRDSRSVRESRQLALSGIWMAAVSSIELIPTVCTTCIVSPQQEQMTKKCC